MIAATRHFWPLLAVGVLLPGSAPRLSAHAANLADATLKVEPDGRFKLTLEFSALAFLLNDLPERIADSDLREAAAGPVASLETMIANGRERMQRGLTIESDGHPVGTRLIAFPPAAVLSPPRDRGPVSPLFYTHREEAIAVGQLRPGKHRVTVRFPEVIGTVVFTVDLPEQEATVEAVTSGDPSHPIEIVTAASTNRPEH